MEPPKSRDPSRRRLQILGALLIVAALGYQMRHAVIVGHLALPRAPLEVAADLETEAQLAVPPGALRGYDVVLVTLDTLRPDRLGCYGNEGIATPNLDRLAREGVIFSNARATGSTTHPTHASIMTGLYPHRHGARANATYALDRSHRTLAEVLAGHGYDTAAFVSSFVLDGQFGLDQGFAHYDDRAVDETLAVGFTERAGDETTDAALRWLARPRERPYFLWVHYYDAHAEYTPPEPHGGAAENPYDGEIAFVDEQVGRLVGAVEALPGRRALVVVTADHGEALGEHGEQTHGFLLQGATTLIPLIVYAPGAVEAGHHVETAVSQVDLMPTILSALGVAVPDGLDGLALNRSLPEERAILAENAEGQALYGWAQLAAIQRGSLKLVDGPNPELYDLSRDPLERENLYSRERATAEALRGQLAALRGEDADTLPVPDVVLEDEEVERLRALGYLAGGEAPSQRRIDAAGPDPVPMLELMNLVFGLESNYQRRDEFSTLEGLLMAARGQPVPRSHEELIRRLEAIATEHPDFGPVHARLAAQYERANRPEDAKRALDRTIELKRRTAAGDGAPAGS